MKSGLKDEMLDKIEVREIVTFHTAMKSGLKAAKMFFIIPLMVFVTFHTAMKSGLKDEMLDKIEVREIVTFHTAMKSGLKVNYFRQQAFTFIVTTYTAMKSGLKGSHNH